MTTFDSIFRKYLKGDPVIWVIVVIFSLLSIVVVYSAISVPAYKSQGGNTEYYLIKHSLLVFLALLAMWVTHRIDFVYFSKLSRVLLILAVVFLVFTQFSGVTINEANRWIMIPVINQTFQPSDLAKLALITNIAAMLAKRQSNIDDFRNSIFPVMMWCGVICGLIALSDMSTAVLLFGTSLILMFIGRVPLKYLFGLLGVVGFCITLALIVGQRWDTVVSRMDDWWAVVSGDSMGSTEVPYQVEQAYIAIAKGGFWGEGIGQSQQRYFLPEAFSDYIYAIINEEYGSKVGLLVILLYMTLLWRGMRIMSQSEKAFGGLLAAGLSFSLVTQAIVNMAVVVGLGPVTGLPLPLLSMGGTSLLFTGMSIGIVLSVSRKVDEGPSKSNVQSSGLNVPKPA